MKVRALDFLLWPVALILLYLITHLCMAGVLYAFEFTIRHLLNLRFLFYFILITFIFSLLQPLSISIISFLNGLIIRLIVRQWKSLAITFSILFILENLIILILFWIGIIEFSWETLKYHKFNIFLFSILALSFFYIPITIISTLNESD